MAYLLSLWTGDARSNNTLLRLIDGRHSIRISELLRVAAANKISGPAFAAVTAGMLARRSP